MKKNYILLSGLILTASLGFSQAKVSSDLLQSQYQFENKTVESSHEFGVREKAKSSQFNNKLFGDTFYFQDFAGGLPAGYTVVNNSPNNFQWVWNDVAQNGIATANINPIASTSAANGFMTLPSDAYNSPRPVTGSVAMDTYFQSDAITIPVGKDTAVWFSYQQFMLYCCRPATTTAGTNAVRLMLQISTDDFVTTTDFDATDGLAVNFLNTSNAQAGETNRINISTATIGHTSFKYRFYADGNTNYLWYIDDVAVIEGAAYDVQLIDPYLEFNSANFDINPFYGQIPYDLFTPLAISGDICNNGSQTLDSVRLEAQIGHAGVSLLYNASSTPISMVTGAISDSCVFTVTNPLNFVPTILGDFRMDLIATSNSVDQNLGNEDYFQTFTVGQRTFARDDNGYGGGTGPGDYVGGGDVVGDRCGVMYIIESRSGSTVIPTSLVFAVSDAAENIGVEILPKIWSFDESQATVVDAFTAEIASSFIPYVITAADTNTLLELPLTSGPAMTAGMSGQIVVGWEVTNTNGGFDFEVYEDQSSGAFQDNITAFINIAGGNATWGAVPINPVVRLIMDGLPRTTGISTGNVSSTEFSVHPNPNNGLFTITVTSKEVVTYNVNVRNMLGQEVYTDVINVNGTVTEQMDLTRFDKGVYFISLENGAERILKKVVVK